MMKLVEFVNAYEQLSVKLGKAGIFSVYGKKKIIKPKAWEICFYPFVPCLVVSFCMNVTCFFHL